MKNPELSAPWDVFYKKIEAMFMYDDEVYTSFDRDGGEIKLLVDNTAKADALAKILPAFKTFGNVTVDITVVPANGEDSIVSLYQRAFSGNDALVEFVEVTDGPFTANYAVFKKEVVQFPSDNMGDIDGKVSTLFEDIAEDIFDDHPGTFFCTCSHETETTWDKCFSFDCT